MSAGVADGIVGTFDIEQGDLLSADLDRNALARPNLILASNFVEFIHVVIVLLDCLVLRTAQILGVEAGVGEPGENQLEQSAMGVMLRDRLSVVGHHAPL